MSAARAALVAATARQSTKVLMGAIVTLEARSGDHLLALSAEERLVLMTMTQVVTDRQDLDDALDEIFLDEHFAGTYGDALLLALDAAGVAI